MPVMKTETYTASNFSLDDLKYSLEDEPIVTNEGNQYRVTGHKLVLKISGEVAGETKVHTIDTTTLPLEVQQKLAALRTAAANAWKTHFKVVG